MKVRTWLFLGILSYIAVFVWRRKNALERIQANVGGIREFRYTNGYLTWVQDIAIQNFDNVSFEISSANIDIISNGQYVGKCGLRESQTIKENGFSTISLTVVCTITDLLQSLAITISDVLDAKTIKLNFSGVVGAYSIFTAPISTSLVLNPSALLSVIKKL